MTKNKKQPASQKPSGKNAPPLRKKLMPGRRWNMIAPALIILTGAVAYWNSFGCGFHFDDIYNIVENGAIRKVSDINAWWNFVPSRPLGALTFALNYHFNQLDVWGYHFVNLCIHIINAMLVWWLMRLLLSAPSMRDLDLSKHKNVMALAAALLFISHPVETQAVTYIVQRLASLVSMFYLLSLNLFIKARIAEITRTKKILLYVGAGISALLAILTKENSFTLPLIMLATEFFFIRTKRIDINYKDWKIWGFTGLIIIVAVYIFTNFSFSVFNPIRPEQGNTYSLTAGTYLLTQFRVITTYMRLLVLPVQQNLDYDYPISQGFFHLKTMLSFLFLLSILISGILLFRRYRLISFGIAWFFITISIESGIIPIVNVIFEHRLYLPSVGFFIIVSSLPFYFLSGKRLKTAIAVMFLLVAVFTALTISRNRIWKDEYTLWSNVLENSPDKPRPLNNFGNAMLNMGKAKEAMIYFDRAIAANPFYDIAYFNRGNTKCVLGNYFGAIGDYGQAIALWNTFPDPFFKRGMAKKKLNDKEGALQDFDEALRLVPDFTLVWSERGLLKKEMGDTAGALSDLSKAIELYPEFPDPYNHRGNLKRDRRDFEGALADYTMAIRLFPDNPDAYNNRGYVKAMMGTLNDAITDFDRAIQLNPAFVEAYNNRANTKAGLKDFAGSVYDFTKAIELNPANSLAMCNRGISKYSMQDFNGACDDWVRAAQMGNAQAAQLATIYCMQPKK